MADFSPDLREKLDELEKELEVRCSPPTPWFCYLWRDQRLSRGMAARGVSFNTSDVC